ncbi:MAG: TonB-dependent receptor [Acidobacteriia bacterium]|nr:TonB-dependent receptor [Terriglobia bacterium]
MRRILLALLLCAGVRGSSTLAQEAQPAPPPAGYEISGTVRAGKTPLPGVTVTASNTLSGKKFITVTALNGDFTFTGLGRGRYVVKVEFVGFAVQTQEVLVNPQSAAAKLDVELLLASRIPQEQQSPASNSLAPRSSRGFQSVPIENTLAALGGMGAAPGLGAGQNAPGENPGDLSALPFNAGGAEVPAESVSITGAMGRTQDFGSGSEEEIQDRVREFREHAQREGGMPGGDGFGGGPGGPGGRGPFVLSRMPRGFDSNQPHGTLFFSGGNSLFDARPYSLTGLQTPKAAYDTMRFGAFVGGPLKIPKIYDGSKKNFFFLGWTGSRGRNPYDALSTVPTPAERSGDFSATQLNNGAPVQIFDPATGLPFAGNRIPAGSISLPAQSLLQFVPLPNLPGNAQNFRYVTSVDSNADTFILRLVHNFGSGGGPGFGRFGGGGGAGGNARRAQNNLSFGGNYSRNSSNSAGLFPSLAGSSNTQGLNANANYTYGKGKITNSLRFNYNHLHTSSSNLYSFVRNVAGDAGVGGVSADPFAWGIPALSFSHLAGLNDPAPQRRLDQTYTLADFISWNRGKHNFRFGGDLRRILQSFHAARNANGSFTFTGFATAQYVNGAAVRGTGYDFADFLLGLPQLTALQTGANSYDFRANAWDLYAQDDFRVLPGLTLNLGLRYEYNGPFAEAHGRIANLDVAPDFTAVAPVLPGQNGPFTGAFPAALLEPDRNNFAPRIGIAWKPAKQTVVRAGYGINYNLAQYANIIQNFAFQPPFAVSSTNSSNLFNPLTLANGFPPLPPGSVTNNFAVDKNYRLGYVQLWNLNIQRELPRGIIFNIGYNGAKGTHLDLQRAPNRNPDGTLRIPGVQPFLFESSAANSVLHAATLSARKRLQGGLAIGGTYVFAKSIDNASSIGGGAVVVAQNDQDLAAERGLSSFDQRHRFTGNWIYELPFGANKRFVQNGRWARVLSGWQWSGDFTIASGLPFTPRVLGSFTDVSAGVNGTLRADYTGAPVHLPNPTTLEWFNTAAFAAPPAGQFGNAGRDILEGPGQVTVNMALGKTFPIKDFRALELRLQANNVFNVVQFTAINTVVNSPAFGQVTAAGNMRRLSLIARFRF